MGKIFGGGGGAVAESTNTSRWHQKIIYLASIWEEM